MFDANRLDFFIVVISVVTMGGVESLKSLRVLRCLRALRPLRMVSRNPSMRVVLSALVQSIPHVSYVSLFIGMVFLVSSSACHIAISIQYIAILKQKQKQKRMVYVFLCVCVCVASRFVSYGICFFVFAYSCSLSSGFLLSRALS